MGRLTRTCSALVGFFCTPTTMVTAAVPSASIRENLPARGRDPLTSTGVNRTRRGPTQDAKKDYMHAVCLGVAKRFTSLWFDASQARSPWYLGSRASETERALRHPIPGPSKRNSAGTPPLSQIHIYMFKSPRSSQRELKK